MQSVEGVITLIQEERFALGPGGGAGLASKAADPAVQE
jgi:hypothetical protein